MTCSVCGDRGVLRLRYQDGSPDDFGVCRCPVGQSLRDDRNAVGKPCGVARWQLWAARAQVDPARVCPIEDLLDDLELARIPAAAQRDTNQTAIADAMRTRRPRL